MEPVSDEDAERIESDVVTTLKTIFDPEIPVDIYELGLIYGIPFTSAMHRFLSMYEPLMWHCFAAGGSGVSRMVSTVP